MLAQFFELFRLLGVVEVLEAAEAYVAVRKAENHRGPLLFFPPDRRAGADDTGRTAAGDTQGVQRFGGQELAYRGAQYRTTIAHARVRRLARALEVQVPVLASVVIDLAQQQPTAITQARVIGAELVA